MYAASATMSAASAAREALNGLSACMVQKALAENFDAQYPDFLALCERFSKDSAVQSRVTFSLSTNKALDPAAILSAYPVGMSATCLPSALTASRRRSALRRWAMITVVRARCTAVLRA